jgi:hypothetical protein
VLEVGFGFGHWTVIPPAYKHGINEGTNVGTPENHESHAGQNEARNKSRARTPEKQHGSQDGR